MSKPIKLSPQVAEETSAQRPVNQTRAFEVLKKKASELDGRLSQAELKITPEAITLVVGDYAYSKGEIDLNLSDYSTLTQTANSIALEIGKIAIGAKNYMKNSTFANGLTGWTNNGALLDTVGVSDSNSAKIVGALGTTKYLYQNVVLSPVPSAGSKLVVSCLVKKDSLVYGTTNPFVKLYTTLQYTDATTEYPPTATVIEGTGDWTKISATLTLSATKTLQSVNVYGYGRDFTGTVWFEDFKIEVGTKATEWLPHPSEISGAKYVFDGSNATFTGGGLVIKNNAGTTVFTADVDGNLDITGKITSDSGMIGGFSLGATRLSAGSINSEAVGIASGETIAFWAGHLTPGSAPFRVTRAGALTARSATIAGSSSVGGWSVADSAITSPNGALKLDATNNRIYFNTSAYMSANATSTTIDVTGSLNVSSGITANGTIQGNQFSTQAIVPRVNETYAIGTSSFRYSGAYINTLYMKFGSTYYTITRDTNGFLKAV